MRDEPCRRRLPVRSGDGDDRNLRYDGPRSGPRVGLPDLARGVGDGGVIPGSCGGEVTGRAGEVDELLEQRREHGASHLGPTPVPPWNRDDDLVDCRPSPAADRNALDAGLGQDGPYGGPDHPGHELEPPRRACCSRTAGRHTDDRGKPACLLGVQAERGTDAEAYLERRLWKVEVRPVEEPHLAGVDRRRGLVHEDAA